LKNDKRYKLWINDKKRVDIKKTEEKELKDDN